MSTQDLVTTPVTLETEARKVEYFLLHARALVDVQKEIREVLTKMPLGLFGKIVQPIMQTQGKDECYETTLEMLRSIIREVCLKRDICPRCYSGIMHLAEYMCLDSCDVCNYTTDHRQRVSLRK